MADDHSECSSCEEKEQNPSDSSIMNKYKTAGEIATSVMKELSSNCISGSTVTELCTLGDHLILSQVGKVFSKNKKLKKGIGFPTCISLNNVICHMSPLKSEPETIISDGDVVKIDLGVHIDGCMACLATTLIVGADKTNPTTGRRADVIMAGYMASEIILKLFRPKNTNHIITQAITDVVSEFQCKPVEGLVSYNTTKDIAEGEKRIMLNPTDVMRKDYGEVEFQPWEVYAVDVFVSTNSDPKPRTRDTRTTVFRKSQNSYNLKMKVSREIFKQITRNGDFAFTLRSFEEENKAKLGIKECFDHHLVSLYPVMYDKDDEFVSHFKFTVIVGPNGPIKLTFPPLSSNTIKSEFKIRKPELLKILNDPLIIKTKVAEKQAEADVGAV